MKTIIKLFSILTIFQLFFGGCGEVRNSNEAPVDIEITTAPALSEVTAVPNPDKDTSPNYTFSSTEVGTIEYGGSCSAGITSAAIGSNTITLNALSEGTYSDCTIIVTDTFGNVSKTLTISSFEIDTTSPTVSEVTAVTDPTNDTTPNYTFSSNEAGTITYGGSCSSSTTSAVASNNTITLKGASSDELADNTTYSDCTVTVTDAAGNVSSSRTISSFEVDTNAPTLAEVTAVKNPTNDTTPNYSFSSSQSGTATYGGSCRSDNTSITASDNITITLEGTSGNLAEDNYTDCTITVRDNASNDSVTLNISFFKIDTTAPTVTSTSPSNSDNITSPSSSISVTFSESMDNISTNTNTSCDKTLQLSLDGFSNCIQMSSSTPSSNSDNTTFTLAPSDNLSFYSTYKIKVTTGARDLAGNNLASDNTTANGFTTRYWTRQLGTSYAEEGRGVVRDSSNNIYVTGGTYGGLDSNTSSGGQDIFLVKYNSDAEKQWTQQLGSSSNDTGRGVAVDSSNNIYVTGVTAGSLDGNTHLGDQDIFLVKYADNGTKLWSTQYGTSASDIAHGVAVHSSSIYVTGETRGGLDNNTNSGDKDIFLVKYSAAGAREWTRQLGTASADVGYGVAVDSTDGYILVTGSTGASLDSQDHSGNSDIFLVKYHYNGTKQWTKQLGTASQDVAYGLTVDSNRDIFITGFTKGNAWNVSGYNDNVSNQGNSDVFLVKYEYDNSSLHWTELLATTSSNKAEEGRSVTVDNSTSSNFLYLTGLTEGALQGSNLGNYDVFLAKYTIGGSSQWSRQMGTSSGEQGYGVTVDSSGYIYVVGNTGGDLDNNTNSGLQDVFLFKYADNGTKQ